MYCLYSVFFSFLTAYTLFPGTFVFFVDLKPANPIIFRIIASSGSSSSTSFASFDFVPFVVFKVSICILSGPAAIVVLAFGPAGGFELGWEGPVEVCFGGGLCDFLEASIRGLGGEEGMRALVPLRAGERDRVR